MAALREICAGKMIVNEDGSGWTGIETTVKRDGTNFHQSYIAGRPTTPTCIDCDLPMREVKGKWACADVSCAMYGKEQKERR
jgi:hypothetical protein